MANDNMIDLVAKLNVEDSAEQINKTDIPLLQKQLKSINIKCNVTANGLDVKTIQQSINSAIEKNGVKINITPELKKSELTAQVKALEEKFNIAYPKGKTNELRSELEGLVSAYQKAYQAENGYGDKAQQHMADIFKFATSYRKEISLTNEELKYTQDEIKRIKSEQQQLLLTSKQYNALDTYAKSNQTTVKKLMDNALGVGRWTSNAENYKYDKPYYWGNFATSVNQIHPLREALVDEGDIIQGIKDLADITNRSFTEIDNRLDENGEHYVQWATYVIENVGKVTKTSPFGDDWIDIDTSDEIQEIKQLSEAYVDLGATSRKQTEALITDQELVWQKYQKTLAKMQKAKLDIDEVATRKESSGEIVNYHAQFRDIMDSEFVSTSDLAKAKKLLTAINNEYDILNAKIDSDIPHTALESLIKRISKVDSQIQIVTLDYEKLESASDSIKEKLSSAFEALNSAKEGFSFSTDLSGKSKKEVDEIAEKYTQIRIALNDVQSILKVAQKEEASFNEEFEKELKIEQRINAEKEKRFNKDYNKALKEEEKEIAVKERQVELAKQLREEQQHDYWQGRFEEAIKAQTAENEVLKDMKKYYEDYNKAQKEAENQQKKTFRENNQLAQLQNRIKNLAADMDRYAAANKRAIESTKKMSSGKTFADEWVRLTSEMARGADLTDQELKNLTADFRVFGKEAETAGLKGESVFGKFLNSFKTMSSYITANMVFNFVKRQLREMVQEVTAVDTAMTELRKVTEASDADFERFARSAGKTGRELGASISDVINATSTFSRAGFSLPEAEELGRVATLYKNVGDGIDIDSASESIISIMKAFNAEVSEAERIVDRINKVSNNFAIDSGGLGESLKRVASAMASANNTLDETIALTTVANEIVQDPIAVAQAWRTVSMRIRGAKAELEQAGEDTEGMVESTAKLQSMIKGMTGIDIMIDADTFKSTYEIIKELGSVWDNLKDIEQAQVLEAIAGKRQANVVASALRNYERLDDVLQTSIKSEGSAMREQEEYAKSIQYSIDTLKAAYQDFAQTVINSDSVKSILKTGQSFLEILTKIVDKIGAIPPILATIVAARTLKTGKGIFGTVSDDVDKANVHLTLFGKKLSDIKGDLKNTDASGLQKVGVLLDGIKLKAIGARVAATALNAALTVGVSVAVSALSKAVDNWINRDKIAAQKAEELRRKQEELRDQTLKSAEEYRENEKALGSLVSQYINLTNSTNDAASVRDELSKLQDKIVEKYGKEADGIDLVNDGLKTNIALLTELQESENKRWLIDNSEGIKNAESFFGETETGLHHSASFKNGMYYMSGLAREDAKIYVSTISDYLEEHYPDVMKNITKLGDAGFGVADRATYKEQLAAVDALVEAYEYAFDLRENLVIYNTDSILKSMYDWQDRFHKSGNVLDEAAQRRDDSEIFKNLKEDTETYEEYLELLSDIKTLSSTYNDTSATLADRIAAGQKLQETIISLKEIAAQYPSVSNIIEENLSGIGLSLDSVSSTVESTKEAWLKSLDETQKGTITNVDKIVSVMTKLTSGEAIDSKSAWEIINLDDSKLLSNIRINNNGDYIFDLEQIVALKDEILQKEIETRKASIETAKENARIAEENIKIAESQIYNLRPKMAAAYDAKDAELIAELEDEYNSLKRAVDNNRSSLEAYNYTIRNETLYVAELQKRLGDLADTADMLKAKIDRLKKEVEQLNKEADGLLKAQQHVVDGIIDKYEDELDVLENQKNALEEQLTVLEKQEDELNDIIDKYKTVSGYVQDTISKQIEEIEDNRKEIEEYYDSLIDKLKTENEEREDAIEYEKKLAALNNAKNNKVRTYDQARGWVYEANKDAIKDAQNDLDSFQNEQAIKSLEKEKEEAVKGFDERIKQLEEYSDEWKDVIDGITEAENELLATEILGSDWREKIAQRDETTLTKFKTAFGKYNTDLASLTKNEIDNLKKSISAVDDEVAAKKKQIEVWENYKTELTNAASDIKNGLEDYVQYLGTVTITENSTNSERLNNLSNFETRYRSIVNEITSRNQQIADSTEQYNKLVDAMHKVQEFSGGTGNMGASIGTSLASAINVFATQIETLSETLTKLFKPIADRLNKLSAIDSDINEILGFSSGGTVDYTGLAMVHGSKTKAETVFSAAQSKKLLNYIEAMPNLPSYINAVPRVMTSKTATNNITGTTFSIANMTVVANNPEQFEAQMKRYWQTKLTESKVY